MKKIIKKIISVIKKIFLMFLTLKKIYRHGGYYSVNISNIFHGEILKNKKILITGGGSGIGLSIARKSLEEGAIVLITGRNKDKLKKISEELNNPALKILVWDVSKISLIETKLKEAVEILGGGIDILVNNAGVLLSDNTFPYITEENWDTTYATNSKGLFFLTQEVCKIWSDKKNQTIKKILNISSQGGFVGATYPYRMTKWDIAGLTAGLGVKLASKGIIVNGIAPGIIATDMQPNFLKQNDNYYCNFNPLNRIALPSEIAELAIFLMSDSANFIVGQTILCDGGFSLK